MLQEGLSEQYHHEMEREATKAARGPGDRYFQLLAELRGRRYRELTTDTQFSEAWAVLAVLLTLLGLALDDRFLPAAGGAMIVAAAVGWAWNELSFFGLHYGRRLSETRAFLGETIELTLEVSNRKFLPVIWLQITDVFPAALPVEGTEVKLNRATNLGELSSFWNMGAFGRLTRRFTVHCAQRGYHTYGPARMATGDGFGMFSRKGTLPRQDRLIIYPRLYTVAELGLPAKNPFGERRSEDRLFEDPLRTAGIRDWQPADGLKRIHWKATARHAELLSRLYEPSEESQVLLFLNVATLPKHWQGIIPELLERAISVAGSLAALCSELRLPVGLIANGYLPNSDQPIRLLPGRSPEQLVRILELLAAVTAFAARPIEEMLLAEAPRLPWGATVVVVTAVAHDALLASLLDLAQAGRRVVLFTLAEKPPMEYLPDVVVYHLPHLVEDLIAPAMV
ncbi:MAG: DUF58 domain-containing protein [Chloroflexi bacterium]|nr:DUF58 domain-containing protein [Chloroflexota bacterium]